MDSVSSVGSRSSSFSLSSSNDIISETGDAVTLADCEGAQPYLFEPYDSEASSGTDSTNDSRASAKYRLVSDHAASHREFSFIFKSNVI